MAVDAQTREELEAQLQELVNQQANPTTDYFNKMKQLQAQRSSISFDDITSRATELSALMPQTKGRGLYGLATDLSKGLLASANSRTPLGTGLAMGLNLYSDAATLRQKKADEIRSKLMQMAYQDVEKRRAESKALSMKMLDVNFKYEIEALKQSGGYLQGKGVEPQMINWILQGNAKTPAAELFRESLQYKLAYNYLSTPREGTDAQGNKFIERPAWMEKFLAPTPGPGEAVPGVDVPGLKVINEQASDLNQNASTGPDSPVRLAAAESELIGVGYTDVTFKGVGPNGNLRYDVTDLSGNVMDVLWSDT